MSASLTAKLNNDRLKNALRRRKAARALTELMDHSVPSEIRFDGVAALRRSSGKPRVRVADTLALSPYIIHLNAHLSPTPREWLAEEYLPAPNLLVPDRFFLTIADAEHMNPEDDLSLSPLETLGQLREEAGRAFGATSTERAERPGLAQERTAVRHPEAVRAHFVARPFEPPVAPANFAEYFELPGEEEGERKGGEVGEGEEGGEGGEEVEFVFSESDGVRGGEVESGSGNVCKVRGIAFAFLPVGWHRAMAAFVLASLAFVLPLRALNFAEDLRATRSGLETASASAVAQLMAGADAVLVRDASAAADSFAGADDAFSRARASVRDLGSVTSLLLSAVPATGKTYRAGTRLIEAGSALSRAGERIAEGVVAVQNEPNPTPVSRLAILTEYVSSSLPDLERAAELVAKVDASDVPDTHRAAFAELSDRLPSLVGSVREFVSFSEMAQTVLGADGSKRYLVVFQNNTELRATGGFMGSFAEIDVRDGVMTGMRVPGGGTYDLQGSLRTNLAAPEPLQLLTARWEFQDANWFPDFPTTARQIMDFYVDAGGGSVDGVVAVNATYVADLLSLLGPVDMPEYGRTIDSANFLTETQTIVELEYDRVENKPKAFIGDLAAVLLERATSIEPDAFLSVLDRVDQGLRGRDIQLYFADGALERSVRDLGWGGEVRATDGDYLMLVNTNLGGGKTDGVIEERVDLSVDVDATGGIVNTLTVTRTHHGSAGDLFTGANNVTYARAYVPQGSTLVSASGFTPPDASLFEFAPDDWTVDDDLLYPMDTLAVDDATGTASYDEFGKTVFGNWVQTKPGSTSTYRISYRLPFTLAAAPERGLLAAAARAVGIPATEEYALTVQKQSGAIDRVTCVTVHTPESLVPLWTSHDLSGATFGNGADAFVGALFEMQSEK